MVQRDKMADVVGEIVCKLSAVGRASLVLPSDTKDTIWIDTDDSSICVHSKGVFITAKNNAHNRAFDVGAVLASDDRRLRKYEGYDSIDEIIKAAINAQK